MAGNCSKEDMRREGSGYVRESVCTLGCSSITQRWKSAGPAGWKPGDMKMPGTKQRTNVNDRSTLSYWTRGS